MPPGGAGGAPQHRHAETRLAAMSFVRSRRPALESAMYKQLLIPTDGSDLADKAVEHGVALARAIGAAAMLEDTPTSYLQRMRDYAATVLGAVAARAQAAGVVCETVHVSDEH